MSYIRKYGMTSAMLITLTVMLSVIVEKVKAGVSTNCFYNNELTFVYQFYDYSGNFSNVKEYELDPSVSCDFIVDVKSKVTWWSDN